VSWLGRMISWLAESCSSVPISLHWAGRPQSPEASRPSAPQHDSRPPAARRAKINRRPARANSLGPQKSSRPPSGGQAGRAACGLRAAKPAKKQEAPTSSELPKLGGGTSGVQLIIRQTSLAQRERENEREKSTQSWKKGKLLSGAPGAH